MMEDVYDKVLTGKVTGHCDRNNEESCRTATIHPCTSHEEDVCGCVARAPARRGSGFFLECIAIQDSSLIYVLIRCMFT